MKKLKMTVGKLTFEEGCNKYPEHCRQRNLREGTIRHYRQSYLHFLLTSNKFDLIIKVTSECGRLLCLAFTLILQIFRGK